VVGEVALRESVEPRIGSPSCVFGTVPGRGVLSNPYGGPNGEIPQRFRTFLVDDLDLADPDIVMLEEQARRVSDSREGKDRSP